MYGTCSEHAAEVVKELGATPIDYRNSDFVQEIHHLTGDGVDAVFDGIGGDNLWRSREALHEGGRVVVYGFQAKLHGGRMASGAPSRRHPIRESAILGWCILRNWFLPGRKSMVPYSIQWLMRLKPAWFRHDLITLFDLLNPVSLYGEKPLKKYYGFAVIALSIACLFLSWCLLAQIQDHHAPQQQIALQGMSPQELQFMRHDIRQQKQKLIGENLPMTESEAIKFWAVYQKYSNELNDIDGEKFKMIHSYAQNWRSMSNDDALIFVRRWLEVDEQVNQLRSKYLPAVRDALPGKKAATFFQLDERISMMINLEFANQLPLLHGREAHVQSASPMQ